MNNTVLGPIFNVGTLPDLFGTGLPPVAEVLPDAAKARESRRDRELEDGMALLRGQVTQVRPTPVPPPSHFGPTSVPHSPHFRPSLAPSHHQREPFPCCKSPQRNAYLRQ